MAGAFEYRYEAETPYDAKRRVLVRIPHDMRDFDDWQLPAGVRLVEKSGDVLKLWSMEFESVREGCEIPMLLETDARVLLSGRMPKGLGGTDLDRLERRVAMLADRVGELEARIDACFLP